MSPKPQNPTEVEKLILGIGVGVYYFQYKRWDRKKHGACRSTCLILIFVIPILKR